MKAVTKPWKRFQEIVDSIDQTLSSVKEVAQYSGLLEGHANRLMTQKNLVILQHHSVQFQRVIDMIEELSAKVDVKSIHFTKKEDIRKAEDALGLSTAERLDNPAKENRMQTSGADGKGYNMLQKESLHDPILTNSLRSRRGCG